MPYKDVERKKEWERLHRPERLARRRELRRIAAAQQPARPDVTTTEHSEAGFLFPLIAGGALAAYNPKLGIGVGGLTLVAAAAFKKDWTWWIVGSVILAFSLFFLWNDQRTAQVQMGESN